MKSVKKAVLFPKIIVISVVQIILVIGLLVWNGFIKANSDDEKERKGEIIGKKFLACFLMIVIGAVPMLFFDLFNLGKETGVGSKENLENSGTFQKTFFINWDLKIKLLK